MRLILAILLLTATSAFAITPDPADTTVLTCYAEKPVLFGKYPVDNTEMICVTGIEKDKPLNEKQSFSHLCLNFDLKAYFQEKERIIFIFVPK